MGVYGKYILPKMVDFMCNIRPLAAQRQKVVPLAKGCVLEVGIGSGLNLPFYDPSKVELVWGLDPCERMCKMAVKRSVHVPFGIDFLDLPDDIIPLSYNYWGTAVPK